jgi:hypothetical protein
MNVIEREFAAGDVRYRATAVVTDGAVSQAVLEVMQPSRRDVIAVWRSGDDIIVERRTEEEGHRWTVRVVLLDVFTDAEPDFLLRETYEEMGTPRDFEEVIEDIVDVVKSYADMLNPLGG